MPARPDAARREYAKQLDVGEAHRVRLAPPLPPQVRAGYGEDSNDGQ
jgi:hypothetical protein